MKMSNEDCRNALVELIDSSKSSIDEQLENTISLAERLADCFGEKKVYEMIQKELGRYEGYLLQNYLIDGIFQVEPLNHRAMFLELAAICELKKMSAADAAKAERCLKGYIELIESARDSLKRLKSSESLDQKAIISEQDNVILAFRTIYQKDYARSNEFAAPFERSLFQRETFGQQAREKLLQKCESLRRENIALKTQLKAQPKASVERLAALKQDAKETLERTAHMIDSFRTGLKRIFDESRASAEAASRNEILAEAALKLTEQLGIDSRLPCQEVALLIPTSIQALLQEHQKSKAELSTLHDDLTIAQELLRLEKEKSASLEAELERLRATVKKQCGEMEESEALLREVHLQKVLLQKEVEETQLKQDLQNEELKESQKAVAFFKERSLAFKAEAEAAKTQLQDSQSHAELLEMQVEHLRGSERRYMGLAASGVGSSCAWTSQKMPSSRMQSFGPEYEAREMQLGDLI